MTQKVRTMDPAVAADREARAAEEEEDMRELRENAAVDAERDAEEDAAWRASHKMTPRA